MAASAQTGRSHPPCFGGCRDLRKNHGKEEARARDLFYALWIPDEFMRRVEVGGHGALCREAATPLPALP